jgi:hypothetical protein
MAANQSLLDGEHEADVALVDRTMAMLVAHEQRQASSLREIGEHVLDEYFGGDATAVGERGPHKAKSFALLASRAKEGTNLRKVDLYRAAQMAIVHRSLPAEVRGGLSSSDLERLASIDDLGVRNKLAKQVAKGELRGGALKRAVARAGSAERGGGPKSAHDSVRMATKVSAALDEARQAGALKSRELDKLDGATRKTLSKQLRSLSTDLLELARKLAAKS